MWSFDFHDHKGAVSRLSSLFCQYLVPIMRAYLLWNLQLNLTLAEKLLVMTKSHALYQTLKATKMNLLQVCPSVPSIVFALLYICLDLLKRG